MFMPQSQFHAHMPFVFRIGQQISLLYCQGTPQFRQRFGKLVPGRLSPWKLQWIMPYLPAMGAITTGLGEDQEECSPSLCEQNGELHLSFIAAVGTANDRAKTMDGVSRRLFVMRGPEISLLSPAEEHSGEECYCGFARPDLAMWASGMDGIIHVEGGNTKILNTDFSGLRRISYRFDRPSEILITGVQKDRSSPFTIVFDIESGKNLGELRVNGHAAYKPGLIHEMVAAPTPPICKQGWRLWCGTAFELKPCNVKALAC